MAEFLDGFDAEKGQILAAMSDFERAWEMFQERNKDAVVGTDAAATSLIEGELERLRRDLQATRFTVGLFGLIKRGKSTLLNALVGREVSSMHVTPETAVPVYVSYHDEPHALVHFADGRVEQVGVDETTAYTSQRHNARNQLGVTHVEQFVPVSFLRHGARLLDTAGLDDADIEAGYGQRTLRELDGVDAGIVVFLTPPTVGATELEFLEDLARRDLKKTFLVCNMYPQYFHDKQARTDVLRYVGSRIVEGTRRTGVNGEVRIYPVCAIDAWNARLQHDVRTWRRSGADRLLRDLEAFLSESAGSAVLDSAAERIVRAADTARAQVTLRMDLLRDPERLAGVRENLSTELSDLEHAFNMALGETLRWIEPVRQHVREVVSAPFEPAMDRIDDIKNEDDVTAFVNDLRAAVQIAGSDAAAVYARTLAQVVEHLTATLEERFTDVMGSLGADIPAIELSSLALLDRTDGDLEDGEKEGMRVALPVASSLAGGGAAFAAAGALLGPLGLVGGALVGWSMGKLLKPGTRKELRQTMRTRVHQAHEAVLRDVDRQIEGAVDAIRKALRNQREAFAGDTLRQIDLVIDAAEDPARLAAQRYEAQEFLEAFEKAANLARRALASPVEQPEPEKSAHEGLDGERAHLLRVV